MITRTNPHGSDISSSTPMPPGGKGIRGWLSAIWTKLNGTIEVTGTLTTTPTDVSDLNKEATQLLVLDYLGNLKTYTDGVEALLATINSDTTTSNVNLASVITALDLIKGYVDNLESYTDGLEGTSTSLNTLVTTLIEYVDGLEGALTTLNSTDFATAANQINGTQQTNIYGSITKSSVTATASGDTIIVTPGAGQKIRLFKFGYSADGNNLLGTVASLKFGSNPVIDKQWLDPKQPYADGLTMRYVDGAINEALKVNLSVAVTTGIYINVAYQLV